MQRQLQLRYRRRSCRALVAAAVVVCAWSAAAFTANATAAPDALPATIAVTTFSDDYDATAPCSLREAIQSANNNADFGGCTHSGGGLTGATIIDIPAGTYLLTRDGIDDDANLTADLDIDGSVTLDGAGGAGDVVIKGKAGYSGRIIHVISGTVVLKDMTLRDGNLPNGRAGAGLRTETGTTTTLDNVVVGVNTADGNAGGILNRGTMTLSGSAVTNNQTLHATQGGGGIFNDNNTTLTLIDSRVLGNTANGQPAYGGGIYNDDGSNCTLTNTTVADNSALAGNSDIAGGGGIYAPFDAVLVIVQSTISGNAATGNRVFGGGADLEGNGSMTRSLVSGNSATSVGDNVHFGGGLSVTGPFLIADSVIDGNSTHASINAIADGGAAGIYLSDVAAAVVNSTISNNHAFGSLTESTASGGGMRMSGGAALVNSTVIGNQADGDGGGIFFATGGVEKQFVRNSTIVANTSNADGIGGGSGGGLYYQSGDVELGNTVIAGNLENGIGDHDDCDGPFSSTGYVLVQATSGCTIIGGAGNALGVNANLAALADNGGPAVGASNATVTAKMLTRSPASGSPLIDAGDPAGCTDQNDALLSTDQRGFLRPVDGPDGDSIAICDIGAVEFASFIDSIFADNFD